MLLTSIEWLIRQPGSWNQGFLCWLNFWFIHHFPYLHTHRCTSLLLLLLFFLAGIALYFGMRSFISHSHFSWWCEMCHPCRWEMNRRWMFLSVHPVAKMSWAYVCVIHNMHVQYCSFNDNSSSCTDEVFSFSLCAHLSGCVNKCDCVLWIMYSQARKHVTIGLCIIKVNFLSMHSNDYTMWIYIYIYIDVHVFFFVCGGQ